MSYLHTAESDRAIPVGASAVVTINELPTTLSKQQVIATLSENAVSSGINIYKIGVDSDRPDSVRILHEFIGNSSKMFSGTAQEYPSFSPFFTTEIESSSHITTEDMRGPYAIYGTVTQAELLVDELEIVGISGVVAWVHSDGVWQQTLLGNTSIAGVVAIGAVALLLGSATFAIGRRKVSVTREVLGGGRSTSYAKDFIALGGIYLAYAGVVSIAAVIIVGLMTGYNQFWFFIGTTAILWVAGIPIVFLGATLVYLGYRRIGLSRSIKGEKPWITLRILSASTAMFSFGLTFAIVGSLSAAALSTMEESRFDEQWQNVGAGVSLRFASTTTSSDFTSLTDRFGEIVKEHEMADKLVMAKPPSTRMLRPGNYGPFDGNSLIVNPEYLSRNVVLDANDEQVLVPEMGPGELVLLIPSNLESQRHEIVDEYREWAHFQLSLTQFNSAVNVRVVETKSNQEPFNYGSNNFAFGSGQKDAVIGVISSKSEILPAEFYVSAASNGALIFDSVDFLQNSLKESGVDEFVVSIDSANGLALNDQAERRALMISLGLCLVVLMLIIFISTAIALWSYLDRQRALIMARIINGYSFMGRHSTFLLFSMSIVTVMLIVNVVVGAVSSGIAYGGALVILMLHGVGVVALLRVGEGSLVARLQNDT